MPTFIRYMLVLFFGVIFPHFISAQQPTFTANDTIPTYNGTLRAGVNFDQYRGFSDEDLANLSAGNAQLGVAGVGIQSVRPGLFESFTELYGMDTRIPTFKYYDSLGLKDNTLIIGFPSAAHQDTVFYCQGTQSTLFKNMYEPIWDNGENGTPVNEKNYYALYVYNLVKKYGKYVKFFEVWNEPGYDYTGAKGWLPKGKPGNWWDNNPDPCDYKLRAPIFNYVRLLRITYEIVKSIQPDAYVVTSGVGYASFLDAIMRNTDNADSGKITKNFPLKGGAYFDGIAFHAYPHFDDALRTYNSSAGKFDYFRHSDAAALDPERFKYLFEDVAINYGYDGKAVANHYPKKIYLITETNLPRKAYGDFIGSNEAQKNWIPKAYVNCAKNGILQMHVYKLAEETPLDKTTYEFDAMGLYKNIDYTNKLHPEMNDEGIAFSSTSKILFGKKYDAVRTAALNLPSTVGGGAFRDSNNVFTYVLWAKTTIDNSEAAFATYTFPANFALDTLYEQAWNFSKTKKIITASGINIALNATPVFLTERKISISAAFICENGTVDFRAGTPAIKHDWIITSIDNGTVFSHDSVQLFSKTFPQKGKFAVVYLGKDATGKIIAQQSFTIDVDKTPTADFSIDYQAPIIFLKNKSSVNTDSLSWQFSDSTQSNMPDLTKVFEKNGNYKIILTAQNRCGKSTAIKTQTIITPKIRPLLNTANSKVPIYSGNFRAGVNMKFAEGWTDEQIADIAAGNIETNISGVNAKTVRTSLPDFFVDFWGPDVRTKTFDYFKNLDLQDILLNVGDPAKNHQDPNLYCYSKQSQLFKNLYQDIWKDNPDGTVSVNDSNYLAKYLFDLVRLNKKNVKFWEIWNNPGWDEEGNNGYKQKGELHNWWENNPDPCELGVKAPVQQVVRMMRIAYEVIKSQDSTAFVVMSAASFPSFLDAICRNTDQPLTGNSTEQFPLTGGAYFDALTYTVYPHIDGAVYNYDNSVGGFVYYRNSDVAALDIVRHKNQLYDVLKNYGYNGTVFPLKKMIVSEINVPRKPLDGLPWGSDELQKNFILKSYITAASNGIAQLHIKDIFEEKLIENASGPTELMGLYQTLKSVPLQKTMNIEGIAFKSVSQILYGAVFDSIRTKSLNLPPTVKGAAFKHTSGKYTYALWAIISGDLSEYAQTNIIKPAPLTSVNLYLRDWDFSETQKIKTVSGNTITLTGTPIFLSEDSIFQQTPLAGFAFDSIKNCAPFAVQFKNKSTDAQQYLWQFSGGEPSTSTLANPVVVFKKSGNFDVSLTVKNSMGAHTNYKSGALFVKPTPKSNFDWQFTGTGLSVQFLNKTSDSYTLQWDFGDSSVIDHTLTPKHIYTAAKQYTVQLTATNECGSDTLIKIIDLKTTSTQDISDKINVSAYPNPFSNALTIRIELAESAKVSVDLCDYSGRIVKNILVHTPLITGDYIFPVEDSELPSGYYWLRIFKDEKVYYKAVVKI